MAQQDHSTGTGAAIAGQMPDGNSLADRPLLGLTLAFDLDGTLIDTAPDLIATVQALLAARGLPPVSPELIRPVISHGSRHMMETALTHLGTAPSEADLDAAFEAFLVYYAEHIADHSRPFDGLDDLLGRLAAQGARLVVCTNKRESLSRQLLSMLGIDHRFAVIAGRDTYPVCKPHPDHLIRAIRDGGGDPQRAVMVGDSDVDVATAKAAGIPVIGVTFGYTAVPIVDLACDALIDSYHDFEAALSSILARQV